MMVCHVETRFILLLILRRNTEAFENHCFEYGSWVIIRLLFVAKAVQTFFPPNTIKSPLPWKFGFDPNMLLSKLKFISIGRTKIKYFWFLLVVLCEEWWIFKVCISIRRAKFVSIDVDLWPNKTGGESNCVIVCND